jgi:hypothetical protein
VQRQPYADGPSALEHFGIFDSGFVTHGLGGGAPVALNHVELVAMEVPRSVQPILGLEVRRWAKTSARRADHFPPST